MNVSIILIYEETSIPLEQKVFIGRAEENQIVVKDNFVSRKHCSIERTGELSLEIKDLNSSNGTFVLDSHGDLTKIDKELLFDNLKHLSPNSILLGKDAEIKFFFPNLKTKKTSNSQEPITLTIRKPGVLNEQNLISITKIYPNAGAAMLRRELENFLYEILGNETKKKLELTELLKEAKKKFNLSSEHERLLEIIRHLGNQAAHHGNVNENTVVERINQFYEFRKFFKNQSRTR